jgi:fermentation-respiration switch protein FrsA (DUF1100 family)
MLTRNRPLWTALRMLVVTPLVAVGLGIALLFAIQTSLIFPAGGSIWREPSSAGWAFENIWLEPAPGERTHAWWMPLEDMRGAVLFSHGNAGTMADRLDFAAILRDQGVGVFFYDYGGYGNSSGRPSEERCYRDIRAAWRWLTEEAGIEPRRIVLMGRSLGGGPAIQLATEVEPAGVIVESSFTSIPDMAAQAFPFLPVRRLVRHRMDNAAKIGAVSAPVFVLHSPRDEVVPFRHGQRLYEAATEPKRFHEMRGGHNDGWFLSYPEYGHALGAFMDEVLPAD